MLKRKPLKRSGTIRWGRAPSLDDVNALAKAALMSIPAPLKALTASLVIRVEDFCSEATAHEMGLDSPFALLGLYHGVTLADRGAFDVQQNVDMITLFRRPILDYWCESGDDLAHVVRHVLIHEIGHHFGLSDADMERIESQS